MQMKSSRRIILTSSVGGGGVSSSRVLPSDRTTDYRARVFFFHHFSYSIYILFCCLFPTSYFITREVYDYGRKPFGLLRYAPLVRKGIGNETRNRFFFSPKQWRRAVLVLLKTFPRIVVFHKSVITICENCSLKNRRVRRARTVYLHLYVSLFFSH